MRIAVWHNLPSGGGKRALYDHVRGLVSRGHEVEVWCPPTADRTYLPLSEIVPEHVVSLPGVVEPGKRYSSSSNLFHRLRWNPWTKLKAMKQHSIECVQQMKTRGFDLMFAGSCILYHTPLIGRFVDVPSVLYLGEPNRPLYEAQPELLWPAVERRPNDVFKLHFWRRACFHRMKLSRARLLAREERKNALAFHRILVNSFFSRESVLRVFGIDATVCYLGVDTEKFLSTNRKRESFAVFLGALIPSKNVEFLVQSLGAVAASLRPKLVLIANKILTSYADILQKLAKQVGVVLEVKYCISDAEVIDLLNRAKVMLYAPRLEPFGYAPIEANACGLPVIAVAEGGVRETIQDGLNGLLVEHEPGSMAAAIERLILDEELHSRLSTQARQVIVSRWALGPSIDRLEKLLLQAAHPHCDIGTEHNLKSPVAAGL